MKLDQINWTDEDDAIVDWDKLDKMTDGQVLSGFSSFARIVFERFGTEGLEEICLRSIINAQDEENEIGQEA